MEGTIPGEADGPSSRRGPEAWFFWACLALIVVRSLTSWLVVARTYPDAGLGQLIQLHSGNGEYDPLIKGLAEGRVGETTLLEARDTGVRSFPVGSILGHVALVALAGLPGFILADVAYSLAFFLVVRALLRASGVRTVVADLAGVLLVFGAQLAFAEFSRRLGIPFALEMNVWGKSRPRPLVTETILLLCILFLVRIVGAGGSASRRGDWAALGACLALLLQGDLHGAFIVGTAVGVALMAVLLASGERRPILIGGLWLVGAFLVCIMPFIAQRLGENPDVPVRFGSFAIPRTRPLVGPMPYRRIAACAASLGLLIVMTRRIEGRPYRATSAVLALALLAGAVSLPLSSVVLGRGVQIYHFTDRVAKLLGYGWLFAGVCFADWLLSRSRFGERPRTVALLALCVALGFAGFRTIQDVRGARRNDAHFRPGYPELASLKTYQTDLAALISELKSPDYSGCLVAATFDPQFYCWWLTAGGGYAFNGEPFLSTVPDAEIERRFVALCRIIGMSEADFEAFIARPYVTNWWYGCDKYQASRAHTFAPLDAYTAAERESIAGTSIYDSWNIIVPARERARLVDLFRRSGEPRPKDRLDLIVLTRDESVARFAPPGDAFRPVYTNPTFRVWRRVATEDRR
jgi:hypothetical protein